MSNKSDLDYKYKKFSIIDDKTIEYKRERFKIMDITELGFHHKGTKVVTNFVPMGEDHEAYLMVGLKTRSKPIHINYRGAHTRKIIFEDTFTKALTIESIYRRLAELTFKQRVDKYLSELESEGYFTYAQAKFFPNGEIIFPKKNGRVDQSNYHFSRTSSDVFLKEIKPEPTTVWGHVKKKLHDPISYSIPTSVDGDVFFALIKHYYKRSWG